MASCGISPEAPNATANPANKGGRKPKNAGDTPGSGQHAIPTPPPRARERQERSFADAPRAA